MIAAMPPRAILLDALGTLVALEPPAPRSPRCCASATGSRSTPRRRGARCAPRWATTASSASAPPTPPRSPRCASSAPRSSPASWRSSSPRGELVPTLLDEPALQRRSRRCRRRSRAGARPGCALVVASNWDVSLHDVLAATGLRALLDGVVTSAEVGASKPAPALFEAALAVAGARAGATRSTSATASPRTSRARARAGIAAVWLQRGARAARAGAAAGVARDRVARRARRSAA